jgi:hypothetical protein
MLVCHPDSGFHPAARSSVLVAAAAWDYWITVTDEIWMGRAEVRPLEGSDPEYVAATYLVVALFVYAESREAFDTALAASLEENRLELVDVQRVGPLNEMLDVNPDLLEPALETARTREPTLLVGLSYESEGDVDEDVELLRAAVKSGELVGFRMVGGEGRTAGFVVALSGTCALVNIVDYDMVALDGYVAVRFDCVIDAEVDRESFVPRALALRGDHPRNPAIPLDDHRTIFGALQERFALVGIVEDPVEGRFIGRIATLNDDAITVIGVSRSAQWVGEHQHQYKDIAAIEFGRIYHETLASFVIAADVDVDGE